MNVDIIKMILNSESLRLKNEDSLLKFAIKMYKQNHQYYELFEKTFKKFIETFQSNDINQIIWKSITSRILNMNSNNYYKEFDGIINYLTNGNHDLDRTIKITSNLLDSNNNISNLIDYTHENYFKSNDNDLSTIEFDFGNIEIMQMENFLSENISSKSFI